MVLSSGINEVDFLLASFLNGDHISFERIYKSYYPILFNYARQFHVNEVTADDAIQDVFIEIWESRSRLKINSLKPYLFRCLRNKISKLLSKNLKEKSKADKYWHEEFETEYEPDRLSLEANQKSNSEQQLIVNIKKLSPKQREIIFLIYYNGLSHAQAAEVLGIKIKTTYNQVHKAINTLKKLAGQQ